VSVSRPPLQLSVEQEQRAAALFDDSIVFICHDHNILQEDIEPMFAAGVTAKQLHVSVDGQLWADRDTFLASATSQQLARERARVGAIGTVDPPVGAFVSSGQFLSAAMTALDYAYWQVDNSAGRIVLAREPDDIREAKRSGAVALLLGSEGSRLIDDKLEVLRMLVRLGLRHLQLSWAWETSVGTPQSDTSGRGLTDFGRDVVRELNDLGVIVDVAHLSYRSIEDVLEVSRTPVLCSHSGAAALNPEQTLLLPDELLRGIAASGGVVAIHFMSQIVKPGRDKATFAQLMAQFDYVANLIGPSHVACGPDYALLDPRLWENQGITVPFCFADGVEDVGGMRNVARGLVAHGFDDQDVRGILGENLLRLFETVRANADRRPSRRSPRRGAAGALTVGTTPL
jgi:membrane dipeptidase